MNSGWRIWPALCTLGLGLALSYGAETDNQGFAARGFQAKGFKIAEHYDAPHEAQVKSLLEGGKATPLAGGKTLLSDGVTMQNFSESNTLQLIIKAPQCLYDSPGQTASSAGPLRVETPDGNFLIEGEGFLWQQTNSSLFISNRVHTVVKSDALQPAGSASPSEKSASDAAPTDIFSDFFSYDSGSGEGIYRRNVCVANTNLNLTGGKLTVNIPKSQRQLENVTAEEDVTIDYSAKEQALSTNHIQAKGQRADFSSQTGLIRISGGNPTWRAMPRQGRADELLIDRTNQVFYANGHAWLEMPRQNLGSSGFLGSQSPATRNPGAATNGWIEVNCASYELHTNWGVFRQNVRVTERLDGQVRGKLNCGLMTLTFTSGNDLDRLVAETNVVIEQQTNRFTGGRAVFTGTNGILVLTEKPGWQSGPRQGTGDLLRVNTQANELLVRGHGFMRLPAEEFGGELLPTSHGQPAKPPRTGPGQFAEITSQEYTLRTNSATFHGKVHACHPRMEWICEDLTVQSSGGYGKPDTILAEKGVIFELQNDDGQKVNGTAERAVYSFTVSETKTNDLLTLFGNQATLVTTNATIHNERIVYDRLNDTLAAPGANYRIEGVAPATHTNLFALPKLKSLK